MAKRKTCINVIMRPNINNSFENLNLQNIVHLARVIVYFKKVHPKISVARLRVGFNSLFSIFTFEGSTSYES
jgi:hypothetical protein